MNRSAAGVLSIYFVLPEQCCGKVERNELLSAINLVPGRAAPHRPRRGAAIMNHVRAHVNKIEDSFACALVSHPHVSRVGNPTTDADRADKKCNQLFARKPSPLKCAARGAERRRDEEPKWKRAHRMHLMRRHQLN